MPLPFGWVAHTDPASSRTYYMHTRSGNTTWTIPQLEDGGGVESPAPLISGWSEHVDPGSGCTYYVHISSGERTWTRPLQATPTQRDSDLVPPTASIDLVEGSAAAESGGADTGRGGDGDDGGNAGGGVGGSGDNYGGRGGGGGLTALEVAEQVERAMRELQAQMDEVLREARAEEADDRYGGKHGAQQAQQCVQVGQVHSAACATYCEAARHGDGGAAQQVRSTALASLQSLAAELSQMHELATKEEMMDRGGGEHGAAQVQHCLDVVERTLEACERLQDGSDSQWTNGGEEVSRGSQPSLTTVAPAPPPPPPLAEGWSEHLDSNSGRTYYVQATTGESTWTRPLAAGTTATPLVEDRSPPQLRSVERAAGARSTPPPPIAAEQVAEQAPEQAPGSGAEPAPLGVGDVVTVSGLSARPELNGRYARVEEWDDAKRRHTVRIELGNGDVQFLALKIENLKLAGPPPPPPPPSANAHSETGASASASQPAPSAAPAPPSRPPPDAKSAVEADALCVPPSVTSTPGTAPLTALQVAWEAMNALQGLREELTKIHDDAAKEEMMDSGGGEHGAAQAQHCLEAAERTLEAWERRIGSL